MSEFWLFNDTATAVQRERASRAIDQMVRAADAARPRLVQVANVDGARLQTAAAILQRALELLAAARAADRAAGARPAVELTVRTGFELTCRARFLLLSPDAAGEFVAVVTDFFSKDSALARKIGQQSVPLPPFLLALVDTTSKKQPRNLWRICAALDKIEGRNETDPWSARASYVTLYQWMSNAAAHGGLGAIRRFTREEQGVLHLVERPDPLTTHWPIPVFAAHVGELALAVLEAFGLPPDEIRASGVILPR